MLDQFGAIDIRNENRRIKLRINPYQHLLGALGLGPDDDAIRLEKSINGVAFPHKLRDGGDVKVARAIGGQFTLNHLPQGFACADRQGAFSTISL